MCVTCPCRTWCILFRGQCVPVARPSQPPGRVKSGEPESHGVPSVLKYARGANFGSPRVGTTFLMFALSLGTFLQVSAPLLGFWLSGLEMTHSRGSALLIGQETGRANISVCGRKLCMQGG